MCDEKRHSRATLKPITIWFAWFAATLFFSYQYTMRIAPSVLLNDLFKIFDSSALEFGNIIGLYYIGYTVMHIPIGILIDKFGPKLTLPACALVTSLSQLMLAYTDVLSIAALSRILTGAASSAGIIGVVKIITAFFPDEKFPFILGLSVALGILGALYASAPVNYLNSSFGTVDTLVILSAFGIALSIIMYVLMPNIKHSNDSGSVLEDISILFKSNKLWIVVALLGGALIGPVEGFSDAWSVEFLKVVYNFDTNTASQVTSVIFIGFIISAVSMGYIAVKIKLSHYIYVICCSLSMLIPMLCMFYLSLSKTMLFISMFTLGWGFMYQTFVLSSAIRLLPNSISGLASAAANMFMMSLGYLFHKTLGYTIDYYWDGIKINGVPIYSVDGLINGLLIIPIGVVIGISGFVILIIHERISTKW